MDKMSDKMDRVSACHRKFRPAKRAFCSAMYWFLTCNILTFKTEDVCLGVVTNVFHKRQEGAWVKNMKKCDL